MPASVALSYIPVTQLVYEPAELIVHSNYLINPNGRQTFVVVYVDTQFVDVHIHATFPVYKAQTGQVNWLYTSI